MKQLLTYLIVNWQQYLKMFYMGYLFILITTSNMDLIKNNADLVTYILENFDNSKYLAIFLDLANIFNTVAHKLFLKKCIIQASKKQACILFEKYVTSTIQVVQVNSL